MKRFILSFLALFFISVLCFSQENFSFQKGRVTQYEMTMTEYEDDVDAEAVVIFDSGERFMYGHDFEGIFWLYKKRLVKIKILKEAGLEYANFEIPLYMQGQKEEDLEIKSGVVYNYENDQLVTTAFNGKVFEEKINDYWVMKKITMPNVKIGSVIELEYIVSTPFTFNIGKWAFQWKIPVVYSRLLYRAIPYYDYTYILKGATKFDELTSEVRNQEIHWRTLHYKEADCVFGMKNLPAFKDEEFISSPQDYMVAMDFQLSTIYYPKGGKKQIMSTWPQMCDDFLKDESFGKYIKSSEKEARKILATLPLEGLSPEEQIKLITQYVKSTYNWNRHYGKFAEKKLSDFLKEKTGNAANLNLFLVGLLNAAKLDVVPVALSTRSNGVISKLHPFESFINYVIAMVNVGDKVYFIDTTEPLLYFSELPERCINTEGLVIKPKTEEWVTINQDKLSLVEKTFDITVLPEENKLDVNLTYSSLGHNAYIYRSIYMGKPENLADYLKDKRNIDVEGDIQVNESSLDLPFAFSFKSKIGLEENSEKLFIHPFCNMSLADNPFKQKERTLPVDLIYRYGEKYRSTIVIPEGYKAEFIPKDGKFDNARMVLKYTAKETEDGKIVIEAEYAFKQSMYTAEEYSVLKNFIAIIMQKFSEMVVLVKI